MAIAFFEGNGDQLFDLENIKWVVEPNPISVANPTPKHLIAMPKMVAFSGKLEYFDHKAFAKAMRKKWDPKRIGAVSRYVNGLDDESRDRVLEAEPWSNSGGFCLVDNATGIKESWTHAPAFVVDRYDKMCRRFGRTRVVRAIKARCGADLSGIWWQPREPVHEDFMLLDRRTREAVPHEYTLVDNLTGISYPPITAK